MPNSQHRKERLINHCIERDKEREGGRQRERQREKDRERQRYREKIQRERGGNFPRTILQRLVASEDRMNQRMRMSQKIRTDCHT